MSFFTLVLRSLRQHLLSLLAAVISLSLGIGLMVAVVSLRDQTHREFNRIGLGVDGVVGPKGSPMQIVLNAVYHLEEMPGKIRWSLVGELKNDPVVERVIPFCTGHSYAGFRVNAVDPAFIGNFEIMPDNFLGFDPAKGGQGRGFSSATAAEAVAGWEVSRKLSLRLGDTFHPVCGVNLGAPVHDDDALKFVGILGRTGTPHDRAIYIPLDRFFALAGHDSNVARMQTDLSSREISGIYLKIRKIRGGWLHPGLRDLKYRLNQDLSAQLVVPNEVLPQLFNIIGWVDRVLSGIAVLVVGVAFLFLFVSLLNAFREHRRDFAVLRALGASRKWVFGLVLTESLGISLVGGVLGLGLGHLLMSISAFYIEMETGIRLDPWVLSPFDLLVVPVIVAIGVGAGLIPAIQAYRLNPLANLVPDSM